MAQATADIVNEAIDKVHQITQDLIGQTELVPAPEVGVPSTLGGINYRYIKANSLESS